MLTIGREGKWQGFETDTQEVLSAIGSAYCSQTTLGKHHNKMLTIGRVGKRQKFETETQESGRDLKQRPSTYGKKQRFETENQEVLSVKRAGI